MPRARLARTSLERLAAHLAPPSGADDPLAAELVGWMAERSSFRDFADLHRDKIRKKLRSASDADARGDLRAELLVARLLLADRHVELAYEAGGSTRGGPDFLVTYRGERPFNFEVTRLRGVAASIPHGGPLLAKLRQMPPGAPNVLLIAVDGEDAGALDVAEAARALRALADAKDEAFFTGRGWASTRAFYDRFLRLGAVVVLAEAATGEARASAWVNRSARIAVPERGLRACVAALRSG